MFTTIILFLIFSIIIFVNFCLTQPIEINDFQSIYRYYTSINNADTNSNNPAELSYVSFVDKQIFVVTTFDTTTFQWLKRDNYSILEYAFDFATQTLRPVDEIDEIRLRPGNNETKFELYVNDGWVELSCPNNMVYSGKDKDCVIKPIIEPSPLPSEYFPVNEHALDRLMFQKHNRIPLTNDIYHPTMYMFFENDNFHLKECPANHLFDLVNSTCVANDTCNLRPNGFILQARPHYLAHDQYLECFNNATIVSRCPENYTFNISSLQCHALHPCQVHGDGFTFIDDKLNNNQFYICEGSNAYRTITCNQRVFEDNTYKCIGDDACFQFENGDGLLHVNIQNTHLSYINGVIVCEKYLIVDEIACDTDEQEVVINNFEIDLKIPSFVYNTKTKLCENFNNLDDVEILFPYAAVNSKPNDFNIIYVTALRSQVSVLLQNGFPTIEKFFASLRYSKDDDQIGLSPLNGEPIDCFDNHLFDVFDGTRYNICNNNELLETRIVAKNTTYSPLKKKTVFTPYSCPGNHGLADSIFVNGITHNHITCLYSLPLYEFLASGYSKLTTYISEQCKNVDLRVVNSFVIFPHATCTAIARGPDIVIESALPPDDVANFNFDSQSYDGIHYATHLQKKEDGTWVSCPPNMFDKNFNCLASETYYVRNIHTTEKFESGIIDNPIDNVQKIVVTV